MSRVFIGIGSNEGDRLEGLSRAIQALHAIQGVRVVQMATIIETAPIGGPPQGPYLNTVVEVDTTLQPLVLLRTLQGIEQQLGSTPSTQRWGPRVIDMHLLLYDDQVIDEPSLRLPHPRLHERAFVREPLTQLAPELIHPVLGEPIAVLRDRLTAATSP